LVLGDAKTMPSSSKLSFLLDQNAMPLSSFAQTQNFQSSSLLALRGGSDDDEEEEEEEGGDEEAEEEEGDDEEAEEEHGDDDEVSAGVVDVSFVLEKASTYSKKALLILGKVTMQTAKAFKRAIKAGFESDEAEDDEEEETGVATRVATKVFKTLQRMIKAAFTFPKDDDANEDSEKPTTESEDDAEEVDDGDKSTDSPAKALPQSDFGEFLSNSYGVEDERDEDGPPVLGGTLVNALQTARSQARLLVVLIPSTRPDAKKTKKSKDQLAVQSLLSAEVAQAANKRARKSGEKTGSFLIWGAKAGSSEATAATKRLKAKSTSSTGEKRPILAVVYPAMVSNPPVVHKYCSHRHYCTHRRFSQLTLADTNIM
jgi:hypothetical protein